MAIIKTLDILLRGQTGRLGSDLKKGSGLINRFAIGVRSSLNGAFGKIAGLATTVTGFLSVAKAVSKVNEQFDKLGSIGDAADKLGTTVKEMQALGNAALVTGVDMSTVELATSKFSQLLGRAIGGNEQAVKTFEQLGLSINSFDGLSATESLSMIFDKINGLDSQAEKAAAAMSIFGKAGSKMFALIEAGSPQIQASTADIDAFGLALTRIDVAKVESASDTWARIVPILDGIAQKIAVVVAPAMTALMEMMLETAAAGGGIGNSISRSSEMVIAGIEFVNRGWHAMQGLITLTQTLAVGLFAEILGGLAKVESGLIAIGGSSFDFGLANLADAAEKVAFELGEKTRNEFGLAFGENNFGKEFRERLDEIQKRAEAVQAGLDKKVFAAPIKPKIDFGAIRDQAKGFLDGALSFGTDFIKSLGRERKEKEREEQSRPAALSRFSVEAQSAINQSSPAAVIARTHKEAQKTRVKQEVALRDIGRSLATGVQGVLIRLGG